MELFASFSTIILILVLFFLNFLCFKKKIQNHLPGSSGWPIFGESLEFLYTGSKGHPQKFILDRVSKYSSNIFKTHLFGSPAVVLCGASNNKFLFSNENKLVKVWLPSTVKKVFRMAEENTTDEKAAVLRKWLKNVLKGEETKRFIRTMDIFAQQHFQLAWENKDSILVLPLIKDYTFSIACRVFLSIEDPTHVTKFSTPFNLILKGIFSLPVDFPGTPLNQAKKAANSIRKELRAIVKQRKVDLEEGSASPIQDILSRMLLTSDVNGNFTEEEDIVDDILGLLIGGHDTVNSLCSTVVMLLAEFPRIYEGVLIEQMEIASKKAPGELLNIDDLNRMKYSWNVVCEAMRLVPPVQGGFREAITDFTHNGFTILKGRKMYWSSHSTNRDPAIFPDPEKFDPSRFEGSGPAPYTYVPFGVGPRMCPGNEYSRFVVLVFLHNFVRRFKWEKVIPNEKMIVNPMPNPENGLPVHLFPHKAC